MPTIFSLLFLFSLICLVIGLIRPSSFNKIFKRTITRKAVLKIFGSATVFFFIIFVIVVPPTEHKSTSDNINVEQSQRDDNITQNAEVTNTSTESEIIEGKDNNGELNQSQPSADVENRQSDGGSETTDFSQEDDGQVFYSITKVTDGDTFKVDMNGTIETVRLIGIDTPETVDPRKSVECFGIEASNKAKELLTNKKVKLEADPTQTDRDIYGRLLRYVWLEDGTFFNKKMIIDGYASEYTYKNPYQYQTEFKQTETEAMNNKRGLWADGACASPVSEDNQTTNSPTTQSTGKYYTSSYYSSTYYYPEDCDGWKSLSEKYLKSYDSLEALLQAYPGKTLSPQCQ